MARVCGLEHLFRLNSIWDPDATLSGHTVVGHSNFAAIYAGYLVKGCKIEINFSNPSADGMVAFASLNQLVNLTSRSDLENYSNSLVYSSDINNTGAQTKKMRFYVKPWSLKGLSKLEWKANKGTHSSAINSNPSDPIYLRVATSGSAPSQTIHCSIRLLYYVEFFERKQLVHDVHS